MLHSARYIIIMIMIRPTITYHNRDIFGFPLTVSGSSEKAMPCCVVYIAYRKTSARPFSSCGLRGTNEKTFSSPASCGALVMTKPRTPSNALWLTCNLRYAESCDVVEAGNSLLHNVQYYLECC